MGFDMSKKPPHDFLEGDVVYLKSGGPDMTVSGDGTNPGYLWCVWFDNKTEKGSEFNSAILKKKEA